MKDKQYKEIIDELIEKSKKFDLFDDNGYFESLKCQDMLRKLVKEALQTQREQHIAIGDELKVDDLAIIKQLAGEGEIRNQAIKDYQENIK